MRTETVNVYTFDELSESAQQKAIREFADINVSFDWWENIYEDAENIGLIITEFDIYRRHIRFSEPTLSMNESIDKILTDHGDQCDTHKHALEYRQQWNELVKKHSDGVNTEKVHEDNTDQFDDEANELEGEYWDQLAEIYLSMLDREYEYLTSKEAIKAAILANEYEFTEDGKQFR